MPPRMPSRALVVLRAIRSPSGTEMTTVTPRRRGVDGLADRLPDHRAGHGGDRRLADRDAQARLGHDADPVAAFQADARLVPPTDPRGQVRAVGDVRVVAGVLHHDRRRAPGVDRAGFDGEADPAAAGQRDLDHVLRPLVAQRRRRGFRGRGRAGAGRPAGAQRLRPDLRGARQVRLAQLGLGVGAHGCPLRSVRRAVRLRAAETVEMPGVVQVRAGAAGGQRRPDEEQRVLPEPVRLDGVGERPDGAVDDQLVRPGRLVGDDDGGLGRVAAAEQLGLQLPGAGRGQEQRHRRAVPRELDHLLARRHRGLAAAEPGEDDRLRDLGNRQLPPDQRRDGGEGADPGDGFVRQPDFVAQLPLLLHRAPQRRVPGMDARHAQPVAGRALVERPDAFQRQPRRVDDLGVGPGVRQDVGGDEAGRPDDHVGGGDDLGRAQGQQIGRARAGADEPHLRARAAPPAPPAHPRRAPPASPRRRRYPLSERSQLASPPLAPGGHQQRRQVRSRPRNLRRRQHLLAGQPQARPVHRIVEPPGCAQHVQHGRQVPAALVRDDGVEGRPAPRRTGRGRRSAGTARASRCLRTAPCPTGRRGPASP